MPRPSNTAKLVLFCSMIISMVSAQAAVKINHTNLQISSLSEPYQICELNADILLQADVAGGIWSCNLSGAVNGSTFSPSQVTNYNTPFYIFYTCTSSGCSGKDSVLVEVHGRQLLTVNNDTSVTWVKNMSIQLSATYTNSTGMTWMPLFGGQVSNPNDPKTAFYDITQYDSIKPYLIYASTDGFAGNVCPFVDKVLQIVVHPTPCMDFTMEYDVSTRKLSLSPNNINMKSFLWEVGDTSTTNKNPTIDVSMARHSTVLVKLTAVNELNDSCTQVMTLNVINGSVRDIQKLLKVYPNPVEDGFTIEFDGYLKGELIQVFNSTGAKVIEQHMTGDWIDCHNLTTGMYSFVISHDRQKYVGRFIKK